jgi:nucleoside-triphosphatase
MAHLFLTGEKQVGKSTLIRKFLNEYNGPVAGFITYIKKETYTNRVYMSTPTGERESLIACFEPNRREIFQDVFSGLGVSLIKESTNARGITIMDELGFMESGIASFTQAVLERLDCPLPVLGVLRKQDTPFLNAVSKHQNVNVLEVTIKNRQTLITTIRSYFNTQLPR